MATEPRYDEDLVNKAYVDNLLDNVDDLLSDVNDEFGALNYNKNYGSQPTTPYYVNDTYMNGTNIYVCKTERLIGAFNALDWELGSGYTDNTVANTALSNANSKAKVFAQTSIPTSVSIGDLWFDTDDGNKCYRSTAIGDTTIAAGHWILYQDLNKTTTFAQTSIPVSTAIGDVWIDTDDSNKMYRAASIGSDAIAAGEWILVRDSGIADAIQAAADAQEDANTANGLLDDIASDTKITPNDKLVAKQLWDTIVVEGTATTGIIPVQALAFSVADTTFDTKYAALNTYLNTTLTVFTDMTTTTTIVRTTWDTAWKDYYNERTILLNAIATKAKSLADTAQGRADTAFSNAGTAQTAANTAQGAANTANGLLADIASDTKLTPDEKQAVKREYDIIVSEKTLNDTQADVYSVDKTDYGTQYTAWKDYVDPLLTDLTTTSTIVGATFRTNFKNYYDARTNLLNAIVSKTTTDLGIATGIIAGDLVTLGTTLTNDYITGLQTQGLVDGVSGELTLVTSRTTILETRADTLRYDVNTIQTDGVNTVVTSTGYTFDKDGLNITKAGEELSALVDNTGIFVDRTGVEMLGADNTGVRAENVAVRTYLTIGDHCRMENYEEGWGLFFIA